MSYLRRRTDGEGQRVTTLELFYDLVFVFAITQVSHLLLEHLRARPLSPEDDRPDEPQAPPRALACLGSGIVGLFVPALALAGIIIAVLVAVIGPGLRGGGPAQGTRRTLVAGEPRSVGGQEEGSRIATGGAEAGREAVYRRKKPSVDSFDKREDHACPAS